MPSESSSFGNATGSGRGEASLLSEFEREYRRVKGVPTITVDCHQPNSWARRSGVLVQKEVRSIEQYQAARGRLFLDRERLGDSQRAGKLFGEDLTHDTACPTSKALKPQIDGESRRIDWCYICVRLPGYPKAA